MTAPALDLAYGRVQAGDRVLDITPMLEDIDSVDRRAVARDQLVSVVRACPQASVVLVPTVWGPVRTASMAAELRAAGTGCALIPRALAIAASHADAAAGQCVVVETTLLPTTGEHWCAHLVTRRGGRWTLGRGEVTLPGQIPVEPGWSQLMEQADAVFIDGGDAGAVARAARVLAESFGVRAVVVDREVLVRYGGRTGATTAADLLAGVPLPQAPVRRRSARAPGVVAAALLVAAAGMAAWTHWPRTAPPDRAVVQVGQAELSVPGRWQRTDQSVDGSAGGRRAVFAAPDDGRRLIVVVSPIRAGSTAASVAESLRNRIAQRGDDAVAEFSADLDYAGRRVIGYRENPASGAPVAWYVTVDGQTQVSIGCQRGTGEESVDDPCRSAVGSVRVTV